jgi:hypothetical protein
MLSKTIETLVDIYPWVAIKIIDSNNKFIEEFAVGYEVVPDIVEDINSTLYTKSPAVYNGCEGHYEWETNNGAKLTMSYGKKKGHDRILIEEITYV